MAKVLIIGLGVTLSGMDITPGMTIEINEPSALSLIEAGLAEAVENVDLVEDPPADPPMDPVSDEVHLQTKALDGQYKRDELYEAAKAIGVDIAFDAKKAEVISAVIAQGYAAALLK